MTAKVLMVQGTSSHVGKSVLTTALCRILRQDGFRVAPFKAQNMSNNSSVTQDSGEIGRAQAVQAEAAGVEATVEMNPILLKPEADNRSQVVVLGTARQSAGTSYFSSMKPELWRVVCRSLDKLRDQFDIVVIEGAGSPAEVNLRETDIVNMRVARYANAPVLLVGDIDRGGVFAAFVGTMELLEPGERAYVKAFVINKFRGDMTLLKPGLRFLEDRTGIPVAGVVPYYADIHVPEEDAVSLEERRRMKAKSDHLLDIAVLGFPHISNFDDFDPVKREEGVRLRYVESHDSLGDPDLIILPGTKTTVADLEWLRRQGFAARIQELNRGGSSVMGVCGRFQMLGERILDPDGVESDHEETEGLGLLPLTTVYGGAKETHRIIGEVTAAPGMLQGARGLTVEGYEIHMGHTFASHDRQAESIIHPFHIHEKSGRPWDGPEGAIDPEGRVLGTYVHGIFHNAGLRRALLDRLAIWKGVALPQADSTHAPHDAKSDDGEYDKLANLVRSSLDMGLVYRMIQQ